MHKWILLGNAPGSVLESNLKILAWSKGLKKEIGFGFNELVINNDGDYFADEETRVKIINYIEKQELRLNYILKIRKLKDELLKELEKSNYNKLLDGLINNFTYYYLARREGEFLFQSKVNKKIKDSIENFRNREDFFETLDKFYEKLSKKLGIDIDELGLYTVDELINLLNGTKVDKNILKRKNKDWSLALKNDKIKLINKKLKLVKEEKIDSNFITGNVAFSSKEKIIGIVGKDVLVAHITDPSMTNKMKKMKVIITDEGGILSHAAIVAREFKIPCVIGTKVATKLLKDGDKVEVDCESGNITKIL